MEKTNNHSQVIRHRIFGSTKKLVVCALFAAMSIVLGKFLSIKIGDNIRISFENLSLIMSGIFFGPLVGLVTAAVADIVGCILYGYAINPIISVMTKLVDGGVIDNIKKNANNNSTIKGLNK